MPNENEQVLGMDASGFRDEIKNVVIPTINDLNAQSDKLARILDKVGDGLDDSSFKFIQADKSGNKYSVTISNLEGKFESTVRLLSLNNEALEKNSEILEAAARQVLHTAKGEEEYNKQLDKKIKRLTDAKDAINVYTQALENNKKIQESLIQQDRLHLNQIERQGGEISDASATVRRKGKYRNTEIGSQGDAASELQSAEQLDAVEASIQARLKAQLAAADQLGTALEQEAAEAAALDAYAAALEQKYLKQITSVNELGSKLTESRIQTELKNEADARDLAQLKRQEIVLQRQAQLYAELEAAALRRNQLDALHIADVERNAGGSGKGRRASFREDLGSIDPASQLQSEEQLLAVKARLKAEDQKAELIGEQIEANILRIAAEEKIRQQTEAKIAADMAAQAQAARQVKSEIIDARVQSDLELKTEQEKEAVANRIARLRADQKAQLAAINASEEARLRAEKDAQVAARRLSADLVGSQIRKSVPGGLDPETIVRANTAIGQITNAIAKGQITAEEALKTFTAVEKGEAAAFEGAAARVANASARILSLQNKTPTGSNAPKGYSGSTGSPLIDEQNRLAKAFRETEEAGVKSGTSIFLSWNQLGKLFLIQALHTLVRKFFGALSETIQTTEQFQIKISEIRTISQDAQQSTEQWATQIRGLSNAFGVPVLDVAEGLYQAISNQIAKGADATNFMTKALEFAKITVSSTADAVNLLTSSLNSFHESEDQTTYSAQILFKTIELGRVRASEMANSFGRLGAIAFPLGVQLDEVAASITTLTRRGIKYDEVQTLISNVMIRLLKPTADMQKLFDKWGVSTGQAAIQAFGFVGVLRKLEAETDSSAAEFADLFKNIRAIQGVLGLTGGAFEQYENDLSALRTKSAEDYKKSNAIIFESAGAQLKKQGEQIKNFFGSEFGDPFVKGLVKITNALSDDGLLGVVKSLTTGMLVGGAATGAYVLQHVALAQVAKISAAQLANQRIATLNNTNANTLLILSEREHAVSLALLNGQAQITGASQLELIAATNAQQTALIRLEAAEATQASVQAEIAAGNISGTAAKIAETAAISGTAVASKELEIAERELTIAEIQNTEATLAAAAAHEAESISLQETAIANGRATAASVGWGKSLRNLAGILSSPAFLFTAAISGITYFLYKVHEESKELAEAWQKAHDVAVEQNAKITRSIEEELAKRERDFKESLTRQYAEFAAFGAGIGQQLTKIRDYYIDNEKQAVDSTKEAIRLTLQAYDNSTRKIEEYYRRSLDNIRKLEEDLDKSRDDFANKQLARQLKIAELKDAEAVPGKQGAKLIDQNQLDLLHKRQQQIRAENEDLADRSLELGIFNKTAPEPQRSVNTKEIEENNKRIEANYAELEAIQNKFFDKRIALEAQHKKTQEDLIEAEKKLREEAAVELAKQAEIHAKDKKEAEGREFAETEAGLQKTKNKKLKLAKADHRDEKNAIQDQEDKARKDKENLEAAERQRLAQKHVQDLKARSAAEEASLKTSPTLEGFDTEFQKIHDQKLAAINEEIEAQKQMTIAVEAELEARKKAIEPLHTALKEIEAFKVDTPAVKTEDDLKQRLAAFDALVSKAEGAGLTDQSLLQKLVEEKTAIEKKGQAELAGIKKAALEQELANNKAGFDKEFNERKRYIEELHKYNDELFAQTSGSLGVADDKGKFQEGTLSRIAVELQKEIQAVLQAKLALQTQEQALAKTGKAVDPKYIEDLKNTIAKLDARLDEAATPDVNNQSVDIRARVIPGVGQGPDGKDLPSRTVGEEIGGLKEETNQLIKNLEIQNKVIQQSNINNAERTKSISALEANIKELNVEFGFASDAANAVGKSHVELLQQLNDVTDSLQRLKETIDYLQPPSNAAPPKAIPAKGHAFGGYIFAPKGTDTVPAMLTPGEFVINARAARLFRRELEQINYYEDGGLVGNRIQASMPEMPTIESNLLQYQFGDFHYHGQMSGNQKADAKAIFGEIQNMIRNGELSTIGSQRNA